MFKKLGTKIHPEAITEAWYAADCPPSMDYKAAGVSFLTRVQWHVACFLRGC